MKKNTIKLYEFFKGHDFVTSGRKRSQNHHLKVGHFQVRTYFCVSEPTDADSSPDTDLLFFFKNKSCLLAIALPLYDKDLRVVDQSVCNRGGNRGGIKDVSPLRKGQIGRNNCRLLPVPCTDYLEKQV